VLFIKVNKVNISEVVIYSNVKYMKNGAHTSIGTNVPQRIRIQLRYIAPESSQKALKETPATGARKRE
jgi:hypothetical protein